MVFRKYGKMNSYITGIVRENASVPNSCIFYGSDGNLYKPYGIG